ncbi:MAG: hypothetical protein GY839_06810 [candidate division Zixibacteria bacterium]|nr:hypothetical protein [candidate division Zixibacteria bacterium]
MKLLRKFVHLFLWKEKNKKEFELYKYFALMPYNKARDFAKTLHVDLDYYKMVKFAQLVDSKDYFLYSVMRTIKKTCFSLLHKEEYVGSLTKGKRKQQIAPDEDTIQDEITESMMDDINFLVRKLVETLVNVICFSKSNNEIAYMIYLNSENMDLFLRKQNDFNAFYSIKNLNVKSSIEGYYKCIIEDIKKIDGDLWFIDSKNLKNKRFSVFKSIFLRYQTAMLLANNNEKILLGSSYEKFFSLPSISIHSSISAYPLEYSSKSVQTFYIMISLLCDAIINRSMMLAGIKISEQDSIESKALRKHADKILIKENKNLNTGDIVLAYGDLAEIIEIIESKFGYQSYKIKYLTKAPIPTILEDYYPSQYIVELLRKNDPQKFLNKLRKDDNITEGLAFLKSRSKKELYDALKATLIDLDKRKLLKRVLHGK